MLSHQHTQTHRLYSEPVAGSLVKINKSKGPRQLPWEMPDYLDDVGEASIKEHPLCSVRQVTLDLQYSRGCKAITYLFLQQQIMSKPALKSNKTAPIIFLL